MSKIVPRAFFKKRQPKIKTKQAANLYSGHGLLYNNSNAELVQHQTHPPTVENPHFPSPIWHGSDPALPLLLPGGALGKS